MKDQSMGNPEFSNRTPGEIADPKYFPGQVVVFCPYNTGYMVGVVLSARAITHRRDFNGRNNGVYSLKELDKTKHKWSYRIQGMQWYTGDAVGTYDPSRANIYVCVEDSVVRRVEGAPLVTLSIGS